ncbi:ATP-binding protein [Fusibacter bizertensis]|uniref:histidine kinase n=1 Tax=Fusibacter bizertensis TaxID=1488331 RepID=A0ABT6N9V8_9FIRM|nr:ATP-binding protein [Fusibacter bizertensis]MDH8677189.1 ATP-binding protein [Fusibacter bizertensis]
MIKNTSIITAKNQVGDYNRAIENISKRTGSTAYIIDDNMTVIFGPDNLQIALLQSANENENILQLAKENPKGYSTIIGKGDYVDQRLLYIRALDNGNFAVLIKALGLIGESRNIFTAFLSMASLFVYILSLIIIYLYADHFTKPIMQLQKIAIKIADLNFNEKLTITSDDEIGLLSQSMNQMAEELDSSIKKLHTANDLLAHELSKEKSLEKMRRQFVSDVSHELKNPISMIMGYADGLVRGLPKSETDKAYYARVIFEEGNKMSTLVKDLLDLSSYNSGTLTMHMETIQLSGLLREYLERFLKIQKEKSVQLNIDLNDDIYVSADPLRLGQVITNLFDNAFKHVNDNGRIRISMTPHEDKIEVMIANTGDLIPQDKVNDIWESFYQIDTDTSGNGLGLAIVKSIMEMHGGLVDVIVEEDMNCFRFFLERINI